MYLYIVGTKDFTKIGVSKNIENRLKCYNNIVRFEKIELITEYPEELCKYIEAELMVKFNSETEYLPTLDFDSVYAVALDLVNKTKLSKYNFKPFNLDLVVNQDGLYDLSPIFNYCTKVRLEDGKKPMMPADYFKTSQAKHFSDTIQLNEGIKPYNLKAGKYGGSFVHPYIIIDYLCNSSVKTKYQILDWMYKERNDYLAFVSNKTIKDN